VEEAPNITITYSKPPIPLVWVDTWVFIKIAQAQAGEIKGEQADHLTALFQLLLALRDKKKAMCPETGQDIEVEAGGHLVDETRRVMAQVSRGVRTHYAYARSSQIYRAIAAYAREAQSFELPWRDLFLDDPIAALAEEGPIIRVTTPFGKEGLEDVRASNTKLAEALEELRVAVVKKNETFEQRLEIELGGAIEATFEILWSWEKHINGGTFPDFSEVLRYSDEVGRYLRSIEAEFKSARGRGGDVGDLIAFYRSPHYRQLPTIRVFAELYAAKLTGTEPMKPSDPMDMNQIAAMLPFASYMLLDAAMRDKVVDQRKLHERYEARVVSSVKSMVDALSALM
jgi:hypothetical protein